LSKIGSIAVPKLFLHSRDDEVVPFDLGKKLFDKASPPKEFLEIRGGHNESFVEMQSSVKERISSFIKAQGGGS